MSGKTAFILVNSLAETPDRVSVPVLARRGVLIMHPAHRMDGAYSVSHEPIGYAFGHFQSQRAALEFMRYAARTIPKSLLEPTATLDDWTRAKKKAVIQKLKARRDELQQEPRTRRKAKR